MQPISYARLQFPPEVIRHAVWLFCGYRDVEELLAERGLDISYEGLVTFAALRRAGERRSGGHDPA